MPLREPPLFVGEFTDDLGSTVRVALATSHELPELDASDTQLADGLRALGATADAAVWDDRDVAWGSYDGVVIRSTWDYHQRLEAFLAWADATAAVTRLLNPPELVRWNADKRYLLDLGRAGLPIVQSRVVTRPTVDRLAEAAATLGAERVVFKPTVSASGEGLLVVAADMPSAAWEPATAHTAVLVQPLLIMDAGEISVMCVEGKPSHAVRKTPAPGEIRIQEEHGGTVTVEPLTSALSELATAAVSAAPGVGRPPTYARVDVVPTGRDDHLLMELELIEPNLYLGHSDLTAGLLSDAILARLAT